MSDSTAPDVLLAHAIAMIERFVAFDTTSRNSNLPLIAFVRDHLAALGIESLVSFDDEGRKANLLATIGPRDRPGVVLSGHTDTVPVDGETWLSEPFTLAERDGCLFGRGTCDMKGFLAIATVMAPEYARGKLTSPIHLAMSYDEEVGCLGVHRLIGSFGRDLPVPRACVVGEPSGMGVVRAHKGKIGGHVIVRGHEAHSSAAHLGCNAVEAAAEAVARFKEIQRRLRDDGPFDTDFEEPNYTTLQCCMMSGGTAVNTIPGKAAFDFDVRHLPGIDPRAYVAEVRAFVESRIEPEMRAVSPDCGFTWEEVPGCAALDAAADSPIVALASSLAGTSGSRKVGFGTEAGYFQEAGIPTVVCGPGDIGQAHKPDEYLSIQQVSACITFLSRLGEHCR